MLTLEDSIKITDVFQLPALIPFDEEQMSWLEQAYKTIEGYKGRTAQIKAIDDALSLLGDRDKNHDYWNENSFGGNLLSLRTMRFSKEIEKTIEEYNIKQSQAKPGVSYWRPNYAAVKLALAADRPSALIISTGMVSELDGCPALFPEYVVRIVYEPVKNAG